MKNSLTNEKSPFLRAIQNKTSVQISPLTLTTDLKTQLKILKNSQQSLSKDHSSPNNNDIIPVLGQFQNRLNGRKTSVRMSQLKKKRRNTDDDLDTLALTPSKNGNLTWKALN